MKKEDIEYFWNYLIKPILPRTFILSGGIMMATDAFASLFNNRSSEITIIGGLWVIIGLLLRIESKIKVV